MIEAIVYDAVGTLIHVQPSVAEIYARVGRRFGSRHGTEAIRQRFHAAFAQQDRLDEAAGWRTDEARERRRWQEIVAHVFDDAVDPIGCFEALFATFAKPDVWSCDPAGAAVVSAMRQRGCRQALASNFDQRLHGVMAAMPSLCCLDPIIISSLIGWRKPAAEFFAHVTQTLRLPPSAILFVGDDRTNDFEPARRAGMKSILLDPKKNHLDLGAGRCESLGQLLDMV